MCRWHAVVRCRGVGGRGGDSYDSPVSTGPYPGVDQGGSLIGGGGGARHRRSVDLEGSGGMILRKIFYKSDCMHMVSVFAF